MSAPLLFVAGLAVVIIVGFLAGLVFRATRIPDILILMGLGVALGPYGFQVITPEQLEPLLPTFTTLALVMILFSGGLGMPLGTVLRGAPVSTLFTLVVFAGCVAVSAIVCQQLLGWTIEEGLMLGAILGGTSSATVLGLLRGAQVTERCKTLLSLESSITDVLCITVIVAVIQMAIDPTSGVGGRLKDVGFQFGVGIALGVAVGFLWGELARRRKTLRLEFMTTLAMVFAVYVGCELLGGSGAVAALVFGIVMASSRGRVVVAAAKSAAPTPLPVFPPPAPPGPPGESAAIEKEAQEIRGFHDELTFLLRTLFFLVLGVRFPVVNPGLLLWGGILAIVAGWVVVRWFTALPIALLAKMSRRDRFTAVHLFPRGMVAAVLATLPAQHRLPDGTPLVSPERAGQLVLVTFLIIGVTTLWASAAVMFAGRISEPATPAPAPKPS